MNLIFFGSFEPYSALILESLIASPAVKLDGVVTTPPAPIGRQKILTKNAVHRLADEHDIPVYAPMTLGRIPGFAPTPPHFFITAGYGKLLPADWLNYPTHGSLNLHFSLLPKYRGANPAEWAILLGETETGISLIKMSEKFDQGDILYQAKMPITKEDTRESLYQRLYELGAKELPGWLTQYYKNPNIQGRPQGISPTPNAKRFTRQDGFVNWQIIQAIMEGKPFDPGLLTGNLKIAYQYKLTGQENFIDRASRALYGYPSLWTRVKTNKGEKRLKIFTLKKASHYSPLHPHTVQLEGLPVTPFNQIKNQLIYR